MFGAVIGEVDEQPDGLLRAHLWFWNDLARIYVTPGARFEVWYARTLGEGPVLPALAGAAVSAHGLVLVTRASRTLRQGGLVVGLEGGEVDESIAEAFSGAGSKRLGALGMTR